MTNNFQRGRAAGLFVRQLQQSAFEWAHHKAHKIFTRRVLVVVIIALVIQILAVGLHIHFFGRMGEFLTAATVEHIFFGVTILED